jgi:DNA-binding NarL/FixJ family response regulator
MSMKHSFLLICLQEKSVWFQKIKRGLSQLGDLDVTSQMQAMQALQKKKYDLILIDAAATDDEALLISRIRAKHPHARVVIVTTSATWRRAREAFHAGAMDYISKTQTEHEFYSKIKTILNITPPSQLC